MAVPAERNQFVQTDGEYLYRVDHGDAVPRTVAITRCKLDDKITNIRGSYALRIEGNAGDNNTGVSVGGFELSDENCLVVGNSVAQNSENFSAYGQRNIFLSVLSKDFKQREIYWLTNYTSNDKISPSTPQLVKLNDSAFLIMWEESSSHGILTKMCTVTADGTLTSEITAMPCRLSDCQPFYASDGLVKWYVTDSNTLTIYQQNPFTLNAKGTTESTSAKIQIESLVLHENNFFFAHDSNSFNIAQFVDLDSIIGADENGETATAANGKIDTAKFTFGNETLVPGSFASPKDLFEKLDSPFVHTTLDIYYDGIKLENASVEVYAGSKGDANLDGETNATDAANILSYSARTGAGIKTNIYSSTEDSLDKFAYFLADTDGESKDRETASQLNAKDSANILIYAAQAGANGSADWNTEIFLK